MIPSESTNNSTINPDPERPEPTTLTELFMYQLFTLLIRGCPPAIVEKLESQRREVLARAANEPLFNPSDKYCQPPFIPVIPRTQLGLDTLMGMVRHKGHAGVIGLYPSRIVETWPSASKPYYVFDPHVFDDGPLKLDHHWANLDEIIAILINTPAMDKLAEDNRALICQRAYYETEKRPLAISAHLSQSIPILGFLEIEELDPNHGTFHWYS